MALGLWKLPYLSYFSYVFYFFFFSYFSSFYFQPGIDQETSCELRRSSTLGIRNRSPLLIQTSSLCKGRIDSDRISKEKKYKKMLTFSCREKHQFQFVISFFNLSTYHCHNSHRSCHKTTLEAAQIWQVVSEHQIPFPLGLMW